MDSSDDFSFTFSAKKQGDYNDEEVTFQQKSHRKRRATKIMEEDSYEYRAKYEEEEEEGTMEIDYKKLSDHESDTRESFPVHHGGRLLKESHKRFQKLESLKSYNLPMEKQNYGYHTTFSVPIPETHVIPKLFDELSASFEDELSDSKDYLASNSKVSQISYSKDYLLSDSKDWESRPKPVTSVASNAKIAERPSEFYFMPEYFEKSSASKDSEPENKATPASRSITKFAEPTSETYQPYNFSESKESKPKPKPRTVPSVPPKKPVTAFFKFKNDKTNEFKRKFPDARPSELTSKLSEAWKNLDRSQKEKYESEYAELMANYRFELRDYEAVYGKAPKKTRKARNENPSKGCKNKKVLRGKVDDVLSDASDYEAFMSDGKVSGKQSFSSIYHSSPLKERN